MRYVGTGDGKVVGGSWVTPVDYLGDFLQERLGRGWGTAEIRKPLEERHPLLQWYDDLCSWQRANISTADASGVYVAPPTGSVHAYYSLAYDLWTVANNQLLQRFLIKRLKATDSFHGARYELYVMAALVRAGFEVHLLDERIGLTTSCEFDAFHPASKRWISVEAKTKGRAGHLGKKGEREASEDMALKISKQLQDALAKKHNHPLVIFIDVNMPPADGLPDWIESASSQVRSVEANQDEAAREPAFVFLTNHPDHHVEGSGVAPRRNWAMTWINQPELMSAPGASQEDQMLKGTEGVRAIRPEIDQLRDSVFNHTEIPQEFDYDTF